MKKELQGILYTLVAGIAWGLSGTCGQYLMAHHMPPFMLTSLRMLVAGFTLSLVAYIVEPNRFKALWQEPKTVARIVCFALSGLLLNQFSYLMAIQETNAGTATVIQYLCPVLVLVYTCLHTKRFPNLMEGVSVCLAVLGTFLMATHGHLTQLAITPKGLFWGLLAAISYASYIILPMGVIARWGSRLVNGLGMFLCGLLILPFSQLWQYQWTLDVRMWLALGGLIVLGTIVTYTLFLAGASLIGPVKASLLASIEPISAVFFAFLLMGSQFYLMDVLGITCILIAVLLVSYQEMKQSNQ